MKLYCFMFHSMFIPKKKKNIDGKLVLVTGAGQGMGHLLAIALAQLGAKVIVSITSSKQNSFFFFKCVYNLGIWSTGGMDNFCITLFWMGVL